MLRMPRRRETRPVVPARPVLVRDKGVWTGRLHAWERRDGIWHGHVRWQTEHAERRSVVPASRLRPFQPRWVEVVILGDWYPGQLVGWRRRPGYHWEGCVQTWERSGSQAPPEWFGSGEIRIADRTAGGSEDAF